jgi:methionyl-tRNA formyltransferase
LRQFGWRAVATKVVQLVGAKTRQGLSRWVGPRYLPPRSAYEFARLHRLPYSLTDDVNSPESRQQLQDLQLDVLVVCVCKNILRAPLLATSDMHFVNIHPSLLPAYRGPTPTFWMRYHGEQQTGFTMHHMTVEIDRGRILAQGTLPLDRTRPESETELRVFSLAAEVIEQTLLKVSTGSPADHPAAENSAGSYHSYPTAADRRELQRRLRQ